MRWVGDGDLSEFKRMEGQLLRFESETPCRNSCLSAWSPDAGTAWGEAMESVEVGAYQRKWVVRSEGLADL